MSKDTANHNLKGWVINRQKFKIHTAYEFAKLLKGNMSNGFDPDWNTPEQQNEFLTWCKVCGVK